MTSILCLLLAQAVASTNETTKPTIEAREAYWRARSELLSVSVQYESAKKKMAAAVAGLCKPPNKPAVDAQDELICEAPKPPESQK